MAIPKKGTRRITIDGTEYRWLIRRKATVVQRDYGSGCINVAIELAETPGTTLIINTDRPHPQDWATKQVVPIQPADIASWIRKALKAGWVPKANGSPFVVSVNGDSLEKQA